MTSPVWRGRLRRTRSRTRISSKPVTYCALCKLRRGFPRLREALFDHLVSAGEQPSGELNPEFSRRFQIDDQLEFDRLLDRKGGR